MKKFRIYDLQEKEYVEEPDHRWFLSRSGKLYNSEIDEWITPGERYVIEWSSGKIDINGKDIFENDLVEYKDYSKNTRRAFVEWNSKSHSFVLTVPTYAKNFSRLTGQGKLTVVGNKRENHV